MRHNMLEFLTNYFFHRLTFHIFWFQVSSSRCPAAVEAWRLTVTRSEWALSFSLLPPFRNTHLLTNRKQRLNSLTIHIFRKRKKETCNRSPPNASRILVKAWKKEKERERARKKIYIYIHTQYTYMYIYRKRKREREKHKRKIYIYLYKYIYINI